MILRPKRSARRPQSGAISAVIAGVTPRLDARPERDVADVGHAELAEIERQERHHQREAGEADEGRGGDGEEVLAPGGHDRG